MTKEPKLSKQELEIAMAACCVGTMWDEYEGTEDFDHMVRLRLNHLIELVQKYRPSLPSNLYEAAIDAAQLDMQDRQFQKIDGDLVDWYSTSDGKNYCCGIITKDAFEVPEGFYIRKKQ